MMDTALKPPTLAFTDSTGLLNNPQALRERAEQEGTLFFRGLLNKERILELRCIIYTILSDHGLLDARYPIMDGMGDYEAVNKLEVSATHGVGVPDALYKAVQKEEAFQQILHQPELLNVFRVLFGEEVFPHPKTIARIVMPHRDLVVTPPHQDFIHIQGTADTWTAWFPLGDCPKELGGLSVLKGSHKEGVVGVTSHGGAGGLEAILCDLNYQWAYDDYQVGDVLLFHSWTVHRAMPNLLGDKVRVSCDFRYQPASAVIDPRSLAPHGAWTWEELYENYTNEELQYYWKRRELSFSEWDDSVLWQKEKIC